VVGVSADVVQSTGIAIVRVDAADIAAVVRGHALNVDVALALGAAVTAGAVDLAVVLGVEVDDLKIMVSKCGIPL
jgi:hypothetical protein